MSLINNNLSGGKDLLSFNDDEENPKSPAKVKNTIFGKDVASNPFAEFASDSSTNPFHDPNSNPFLSSNPFRITEDEDKKSEDEELSEVDSPKNVVRIVYKNSAWFNFGKCMLRFYLDIGCEVIKFFLDYKFHTNL